MNEETDDPASGLTDAQVTRILHEFRNRDTSRLSVRAIAEQLICEYAGVPYDPTNQSHKAVMQKRWEAVVRMQGEQAEHDRQREARGERREAAIKAVWEKFISIVTGMVVLLGLGWIAGKLGIKLPGAG